MKVLVTGGAGFIGCNLVRHLIQKTDAEVVCLDKLTYAGNLQSLADVAEESRYVFERVDITDAKEVQRVFREHRPDAVMHLAAESHVDRSIDAPGEFIQTNVVGTFNLLQSALAYWIDGGRSESFRFLHVSTDEVYGSLGPDDEAFSESTAYDPRSPYSASKAGADHLVRAWHVTYGLPVLLTNCSNNYGPYQYPEKLIPVVILKCLHGEAIPVYGKGDNVRDWIHVGDHVAALDAVWQQGTPGETYNIGGDNERSNIELVKTICDIIDDIEPAAGRHAGIGRYTDLISHVEDRPGHDRRYAMNTDKIRRQLGWQPQVDFSNGLRQTVEWYLGNREWCASVQA